MPDSVRDNRLAVGVMTGTSIDGIDAALVRVEGRGLDMRAALVRHVSEPLGDLQPRLRAAANQQPMTAGDFARLAWDFGMLHAEVIGRLLDRQQPADLICVHGQTVFHQPPISWQLVNPAPIAARFHCPVVSDLRQADLAQGGQGAPITPLADWILFRDETKSRAIINLGGFCNITILPCAKRAGSSPAPATSEDILRDISGFDVCASNQLLDAIAREVLNQPFDKNGAAASRGVAKPQAMSELAAMLDLQRRGRRSLGTGDEALQWITTHRASMSGEDLAASAVHAIARTIHDSIREQGGVQEVILAGGGARNLALRRALEQASAGVSARTTSDLGVPLEAREAMCFAVLGALCQDGIAITLPQVTGCGAPAPVSGVWSDSHRRR